MKLTPRSLGRPDHIFQSLKGYEKNRRKCGEARSLTASGLRMTRVDSSPSPRIFAHVCPIVSCDAMLVTIAPMIAKNKLRDLCRGAIFTQDKKKNSIQVLSPFLIQLQINTHLQVSSLALCALRFFGVVRFSPGLSPPA